MSDNLTKPAEFHGVLELIPSIRLYDYEKVCGAVSETAEYPEEFCLNDVEMGAIVKEQGDLYSSVIKNQGMVGACVGCATSSAIEALKLRSALNLELGEELTPEMLKDAEGLLFECDEVSEGYTYATCRRPESTGWGMIVSTALDYLKNQGTVPKKYFNILKEMPEIKKIAAKFPELKEVAKNYKIESYAKFNQSGSKKDKAIKDALMKYRVPLIAVSPRYFGEAHCICIVGWNDKEDTWKIKNSWGKSYGKNGLADVKRTYITEVYILMDKEIKLPFKDVKEDDWFYSGVKQVFMSDIMNGRSTDEFVPDGTLTRAEYAVGMARALQKIEERLDNLNKVLEEKFSK